ncbi:hypothetical protein GH721_16340 [Kriegella sp. EG-1]|nr:hypothetical protein [Flavobacteriaceae bacterium EG-1]
MHTDFETSTEVSYKADICIIGSGAAGFACALSFLKNKHSVILLEGGLHEFNAQAADIHQAEISGFKHGGIHEARERIVGGTTTTWGGQALPFMKEDFEKRAFIPNSGWPISFEELAPYYKKAEDILGTDQTIPFTFKPWKDWGVKNLDFNTSILEPIITKWCQIPNFQTQHGEKIKNSKQIQLLTNANVTEILPDSNNAVAALTIKSLSGKTGAIKAKYYIAAGGAFETVRLFLNSKKFHPSGLGNENNLVGRYIFDHVAATVGQILPKSRNAFQNIFDTFYKNGFKYLPRLKLNPEHAIKNQILFASAQIVFTTKADSTLELSKELFSFLIQKQFPKKYVYAFLKKPSRLIELLAIVYRWKFNKRGTSPKKGSIWLEVHSEQEPNADSKIILSDKRDVLGMQRINLKWSISDVTIKTIRKMALITAKEMQNSDIAHVKLKDWITNKNLNFANQLTDTYHQAGGLKMSNYRKNGVVNENCMVYGVENLYIASSAVFPSSSFSNPTMTIIALAIRISEKIDGMLNCQH